MPTGLPSPGPSNGVINYHANTLDQGYISPIYTRPLIWVGIWIKPNRVRVNGPYPGSNSD